MNRFALLLVGLLCVGCGRQSGGTFQVQPSASAAVAPISENELFAAYEGNEAAADAKFLGKTVAVKAVIYKVAKTPQGDYYAGAYKFTNSTEFDFCPFLGSLLRKTQENRTFAFFQDARRARRVFKNAGRC